MPSKSKKQARFMAAAAHSKAFAKKAGIKQSVAQEFHSADQHRKHHTRRAQRSTRRKHRKR